MINQLLTTGIFGDAFKLSKVIPLYKKGDSSLLVNYRPISLLPTISKIFEKVIHDQLYEYFDKYNLLSEQQYDITWKSHIEMVGKKISKVTGILYKLKNIVPANELFVLCNSLIASYKNYGLLL